MEQKRLNEDITNKNLQPLYLLYGEERFLINYYAKKIKELVPFTDIFESSSQVSEIIMAAETLPFGQDRRLIFIKNSNLFSSERKSEAEELANYLQNIPKESTIVIIEPEVDRRVKLFKEVVKYGLAVNCETPNQLMLNKWIKRTAKEKEIIISDEVSNFLQSYCGTNMSNLFNEINKLVNFCGKKDSATVSDVKEICTQTLEARIFDLTKAMGDGNAPKALTIYKNMLSLKESPFVILSMIIRQLRLILLTKAGVGKSLSRAQIAKDLNIRDFVINEVIHHGKRFSQNELILALKNCQEIDLKLKTGLLSPEIGVEILLAEIATK